MNIKDIFYKMCGKFKNKKEIKKCSYCGKEQQKFLDENGGEIYLDDNIMMWNKCIKYRYIYFRVGITVNYCPMCGRKFEENEKVSIETLHERTRLL